MPVDIERNRMLWWPKNTILVTQCCVRGFIAAFRGVSGDGNSNVYGRTFTRVFRISSSNRHGLILPDSAEISADRFSPPKETF